MRRLLTLTVAALTLGLVASGAAQAAFVFKGGGWGHGVGMAQWGAYGFAKNGWTYDRILAHYYQGTTLGQAPVERIRILLAAGRGSMQISSETPFAAVDSKGKVQLPAGTFVAQVGKRRFARVTLTAGEAPVAATGASGPAARSAASGAASR